MTNTERLHNVLSVHSARIIVERVCRETGVSDPHITGTLSIAVSHALGDVSTADMLRRRATTERLASIASSQAVRHALTLAAMCCEPDAGWALTLVETAA